MLFFLQISPLLQELREAGIAQHIEGLVAVANETAGDIRDLEKAVLDADNVKELKKSVKTLTRTLQHIESIAGEVSTLSSDSAATASLRQLIEAFSRLVAN
jgi:23S rRNA C2498 (ribose-2'-O)-methylase RlmM